LPTEPAKEPFPIFIYGGSTAMGISGIQYAKASGLTVITTASPQNIEYIKSLGADEVLDYKSPTLAQDVRRLTGGNLKYAWDCYAAAGSGKICAEAMSESGGQIVALLFGTDEEVKKVNDKISVVVSLFYTVFGEEYDFRGPNPGKPENYEFGKMFWELSRRLLAEGTIKPIRIIKNQGGSGLEGVLEGIKLGAEGKYSAQKLVYTL
jgi:NADPH:quinone reductase-like Zn-dependent oxidoreductase